MSDDLEIRGGGAVAVDTETLRRTASGFADAQLALDDLAARARSLQHTLRAQGRDAWEADDAVGALAARIRDAADEAAGIAARLRAAAAVYELVELDAAAQASALAGDHRGLARIARARERLWAEHPLAAGEAWFLAFERAVMWPSELVRQATETGLKSTIALGPQAGIVGGATLGVVVLGFGAVFGVSGAGRVPRSARLSGVPPPVAVTTTLRSAAAAPATLAAAASRIPHGTDARVRVERYTMPDGSRQFALYVAGTRDVGIGGDDPWDNASNLELYGGTTSASYAATTHALEAAGAQPGDVVHAFGHSQGALITSHLALEGEYDTRTLVSLGSPVEAEVGPQTLSVGIRHTDDPVAGLAGGGHAAPVGAAGSFVVETAAAPATGPDDFTGPAHRLTAYLETAARVDAAADPRVAALREVFAELGTATDVEATEFAARRVTPSSAGAG